MTALFSADRVYRYTLDRWWADRPDSTVCWVLLNPSTADETADDPTIRRCIGFATGWGYDGLTVVNLFGLRATDPKVMLAHRDPVGAANDVAIAEAAQAATLVVCAWGAHGAHRNRGLIVADRLRQLDVPLYALGFTKGGHPQHPLYLAGNREPELWEDP